MESSRANNFGTFLQTMNIGKAVKPADIPEFDLETSAKRALQGLLRRSGISKPKDLGDELGVSPEQLKEVLDYLVRAGMVALPNEDAVMLTGFGKDAMGVFAVA